MLQMRERRVRLKALERYRELDLSDEVKEA